jgi:hypothetical protein
MPKKRNDGAVRNGRPRRLQKFKLGDRVRILDIAADLTETNYDLKSAEAREMRTAELFRFCVGRVFTVQGFDRYGNVELPVGDSLGVRKKFGRWHSIWCEPGFLKLADKKSR